MADDNCIDNFRSHRARLTCKQLKVNIGLVFLRPYLSYVILLNLSGKALKGNYISYKNQKK